MAKNASCWVCVSFSHNRIMKKNLFKVISLIAFAMPTLLYAVPATQKSLKLRQPDGTFVNIYMYGDEHSHYITDTKGYPV